MNGKALVRELGEALGAGLEMSGRNTCGVFFDEDEVVFEMHGGHLYVMADIGPAAGRRDAHTRLLEADCLGAESGQACIGLDAQREVFTLHRILEGELTSAEFEKALTLFIRALRYWKAWLAQPPSGQAEKASFVPNGVRP